MYASHQVLVMIFLLVCVERRLFNEARAHTHTNTQTQPCTTKRNTSKRIQKCLCEAQNVYTCASMWWVLMDKLGVAGSPSQQKVSTFLSFPTPTPSRPRTTRTEATFLRQVSIAVDSDEKMWGRGAVYQMGKRWCKERFARRTRAQAPTNKQRKNERKRTT